MLMGSDNVNSRVHCEMEQEICHAPTPLHHNHYPTPAIQPVLCPFGTAFGLVSPLLYASDPHGGILLLSSLNTLGSGLPLARAQGLIVMW